MALQCAATGFGHTQQSPQDEIPLAPQRAASHELFRIRIENKIQGSIRVSADGGLRYTLIGRVTRPANVLQVDRSATMPGEVARSSGDGVAFAINLGQTLKLLPNAPQSSPSKRGWPALPPAAGAILTNIAPRTSIFADLLPPPGTQAKLEIAPRSLRPFPSLYDPQQEEDPIVLVVARRIEGTANRDAPQLSALTPQQMEQRIAAVGQAYLAQSLTRARQEHRPIVSGVLTLKAKLPEGEPDPIAYVQYVVDNQIVSSQNVAPFQLEWDTRREADGEHLVEVRALNRNSHLITSKTTLLVVQNKTN